MKSEVSKELLEKAAQAASILLDQPLTYKRARTIPLPPEALICWSDRYRSRMEWLELDSNSSGALFEIVTPRIAGKGEDKFRLRDIESGDIFVSDEDNFIPLTKAARALVPRYYWHSLQRFHLKEAV